MPSLHRRQERPVVDESDPTEELGVVTREEEPAPEEEVPRIHVEIPRCTAQIGSDLHFVKLPNFLSVETRSVF